MDSAVSQGVPFDSPAFDAWQAWYADQVRAVNRDSARKFLKNFCDAFQREDAIADAPSSRVSAAARRP